MAPAEFGLTFRQANVLKQLVQGTVQSSGDREAIKMHCYYLPTTPVRVVVTELLVARLPGRLPVALSELVGRASRLSAVGPHMGKRWGELTDDERFGVVDAVGMTARAASATRRGPAATRHPAR